MLANLFNSEDLHKEFHVSFSYRYSALYTDGLKRKLRRKLTVSSVGFPDLFDLSVFPDCVPLLIKRIFLAFLRLLLTWPLLAYEIVILFRLLKKHHPDILHINNGGYPAALSARAASIAAGFANIPNILMVVNNMAADYRHYSRWMDYPVDRLVVRAVTCFVTGSAAASNQLQKVLVLPMSKLTSIHNGVALRSATESIAASRQRLGLADFDGVVFGVVALLIPRKGHQVLLEAVLKLVTERAAATHGNFVVLIEGDGPLRQELSSFVQQNDLSGYVRFVGDEKNVVDFMTALDVLVLPSVQNEDFPNVVIEAMALGKPVIASRLAGTPEQIDHGVTGLLVEPRRADELASAMSDLMADSQLRARMGAAAMDCFNNKFTSNKAVANYMTLYKQLTGSVQ